MRADGRQRSRSVEVRLPGRFHRLVPHIFSAAKPNPDDRSEIKTFVAKIMQAAPSNHVPQNENWLIGGILFSELSGT